MTRLCYYPAMLILVISDIHANLTALNAVLDDAEQNAPSDRSYEAVWCLGDLVGYGPDPNECIERVRKLPGLQCLIGNHDQAVLGLLPLSRFNRDARAVAAWTVRNLTRENKAFLEFLPERLTMDNFTLAHGSPLKPTWEYILDPQTAERNFQAFEADYCIVGHSHLPIIFHLSADDDFAQPLPIAWDRPMALIPRMILNPGSVGQPRDLDPRASYAFLDTEAVTWEARRVTYDVSEVQMRILHAGLPERQALRLIAGW